MKNLISFKHYMESERKAQNTIDSYYHDVEKFIEYCDKPSEEICFTDYYAYRATLGHMRATSINRKQIAISQFFDFMVMSGLIERNFIKDVKRLPENDSVQKEYIPMDKARKLIMYAKNDRERAMVAVMLTTGLRISEVINLTLDDYGAGNTNVVAKGHVKRFVTFSNDCCVYINKYLETRKECNLNNLFISNQCTPINSQSFSRTLKIIAKRAGIEEDISNHSLRHTFISEVCNKHGISVAQHVVGHSDIKITQRYAHNTKDEMINVMNGIAI